MFDQIVQAITDYPYLGVALVFLLCGLGFPLPEEIVLLSAGYVCAKFPDHAALLPMMGWCAGAILCGDVLPFLLGRIFGVRLLRLRWLRYFITKRRLATFDHWFRRRGDMVIVISRFLAGLRVVAFFTAGAMKMKWHRFLFLDGLGIILMVPLLTWIGYRSAGFIEEVIVTVQRVERGLLWGAIALGVVLAVWYFWWRRRHRRKQRRQLTEAFVQPKLPVQEVLQGPPTEPGGVLPGSQATAPAQPTAGDEAEAGDGTEATSPTPPDDPANAAEPRSEAAHEPQPKPPSSS